MQIFELTSTGYALMFKKIYICMTCSNKSKKINEEISF